MPPIAVLNQTRGQTLTTYYHPTSLHLKQSGAASIMSCDFRVTDLSPGATLVLEPEDLIKITDGGSTAFRGPIRTRNRTDTGLGPTPKKAYKITCQDMTSVLTDVVIDDELTGIRPEETDRERVQALVAAYPGEHGLTAPTATVGNLQVSDLPAASYMGLSLYEALEQIARLLSPNAQFYVDFNEPPRVHWFHAESEVAPFQLSNTPNNVTTFGYDGLEMPDDTFELVNAVYAMGGAGTTPVWIDDGTKGISNANAVASIAAYGRREGSYVDPEQTSQATLQALAAAMIGRLAFPKGPKKLTLYRPGLRAGMTINLTNTLWGMTDVPLPIKELSAKPILDDNTLAYDLTLDDGRPSLSGEIGRQDSAITSAISAAAQALEQAPDATAPTAPTGLVLTSGYDVALDGTLRTFVDAEWNPNAEPDLQAYELQIDEASRSEVVFVAAEVVGGGTMPAGTYSVQVTALGPHGETRASVPEEVAIAAGNRLGVTITAFPNATGYRIFASRTEIPLFVQSTVVTGSQVVINAEGSGVPAPTLTTYVDFANPLTFRTAIERVHMEDLLAGTYYAARVRALDDWNNRSAYSGVVGVTTARDIVAPEIPGGLSAVPGFRLVGLNWQRSSAIDLDRYEIRWTYDLAGAPDPAQWTKLTSRSNVLVIADLAPDVVHWFEVRAIDRSNNVQTSAVDTTAVDADQNGEAGWSDPVAATPTLVGAADVAFNSVLTSILNANEINADDIKAGTLSLGGLADTPDFLLVYNTTGQEIGRWDQDGLVIRDPNNTSRMVRLINGTLSFSLDGGTTWTTAVSADGIVADSIRLGSAPGGHNAIPNASFELSAFSTYFSKVWTATTDWDDATSQVALGVSGSDLTLTNATY